MGTASGGSQASPGCWLVLDLGAEGWPVFIQHSPNSHPAFPSSRERAQEHLGLASVLVPDSEGAHATLMCPVLGADRLWGKGYALPHPHSRAQATVWSLQAGQLGVHRNHTCCHSCLLLASSKFQTCQWRVRANAATGASPRRATSAPETQ